MKKINKALISCAGFGTRFLPISKTIQKEMLPILNKPVLEYIVDDCISAGISEFIFVINSHNYQPLHYFRENTRLKKYLEEMGKSDLYSQLEQLHQKASFKFVKQSREDPYGTSVPLFIAKDELLSEEAFLYLTGDDFIYYPNQKSFIKELIEKYQQTVDANAVVSCIQVDRNDVEKFGVIETKEVSGHTCLTKIIEKPTVEEAPSNLVNISKYVLTPSIFSVIFSQEKNSNSNEFFVTDALQTFASDNKVLVHTTNGKYLNAGDPISWLKANLTIARNNPLIKTELEKFLETDWK